jgi:hypothetical protein
MQRLEKKVEEEKKKQEFPLYSKIFLFIMTVVGMDHFFGDLLTKNSNELYPWWVRYLMFSIILIFLWAEWQYKKMKWKALERLSGEDEDEEKN